MVYATLLGLSLVEGWKRRPRERAIDKRISLTGRPGSSTAASRMVARTVHPTVVPDTGLLF